MKPFIIELVGTNRRFEVPRGAAVFIGRDNNSDFIILDGTIGKPHAMVTSMPHELSVMVVDVGCMNGIFVDGERKIVAFVKLNGEFRLAQNFVFRVTAERE